MPKHEIALIEEVPGLPLNERWFIWERAYHETGSKQYTLGRGKLWNGPTREAGEAWAKENNVIIDEVEYFGL